MRLLITRWAPSTADEGRNKRPRPRPPMQPFCPGAVPDAKRMPRPQQAMSHPRSHVSEAKKCDVH